MDYAVSWIAIVIGPEDKPRAGGLVRRLRARFPGTLVEVRKRQHFRYEINGELVRIPETDWEEMLNHTHCTGCHVADVDSTGKETAETAVANEVDQLLWQ